MRHQERLPRLLPDQLDAAQSELYLELTGGPRSSGPQAFRITDQDGGLRGPFNAMLLDPALGGPLQSLGTALRYHGSLPARARELAILLVAAHWGSDFEQSAHEAIGEQIGLTRAELVAARDGASADPDALGLTDPVERAVVETTAALLSGDLSDREYSRLAGTLSATTVFELVCLVGYYGTLALSMRVFRVDPGPGGPVLR